MLQGAGTCCCSVFSFSVIVVIVVAGRCCLSRDPRKAFQTASWTYRNTLTDNSSQFSNPLLVRDSHQHKLQSTGSPLPLSTPMPIPAFAASLPLSSRPFASASSLSTSRRPPCHRHHPHTLPPRSQPTMTSPADIKRGESTSELSTNQSQIPSYISSTPLLDALYSIFSRREDPGPALARVLTTDADWDTPLFALNSCTEAADYLSTFLSFVMDPTIYVHSADQAGDTLRFSWFISFTYPLPWRPRVSLSGTSIATLKDGLVSRIEDDWCVPPRNLIVQALPTLTDIVWLWPTPHGENDIGSRRLIRETKTYKIVKRAPHKEIRIRQKLSEGDREMVWAVPCLPEELFEGSLRKKELYSTVTPISLHKVEEEVFEWAVPVPGTLVGSSDVLVVEPTAENAKVVDVGERTLAIVRFRGLASRTVVEKQLNQLADSLIADGVMKDKSDVRGGAVWVRSYDGKVGFNSKGILAIATYGATYGLPRLNELSVDLTDVVATIEVSDE